MIGAESWVEPTNFINILTDRSTSNLKIHVKRDDDDDDENDDDDDRYGQNSVMHQAYKT